MPVNEDYLLYCLARLEIDEHIRERIKGILSKGLDWNLFLQKARESGTGSLIYRTINKNADCGEMFPESIKTQLSNIYYSTFKKNILFAQALEEVAGLLEKENVEVIIFKGLMLAELIYGDLGLRSMSDIDILVKKYDFAGINTVMEASGYSSYARSKDNLQISVNEQRNSLLYSKIKGITIYWHVYWHLINSLQYNRNIVNQFDIEKIWQNSRVINLGKARLRTFSLYHQIIYLCMHAMQHSFRPLILLCDINESLRLNKERINWDVLVEEAFKFGLAKHLYYGLYFTRQILWADVPEGVLNRLKPERTGLLEKKFIAAVLNGQSPVAGCEFAFLGMNEDLADKIHYVLKLLFPSKRELALIKQKNISEVNTFDYVKRVCSAFGYAARFLLCH